MGSFFFILFFFVLIAEICLHAQAQPGFLARTARPVPDRLRCEFARQAPPLGQAGIGQAPGRCARLPFSIHFSSPSSPPLSHSLHLKAWMQMYAGPVSLHFLCPPAPVFPPLTLSLFLIIDSRFSVCARYEGLDANVRRAGQRCRHLIGLLQPSPKIVLSLYLL